MQFRSEIADELADIIGSDAVFRLCKAYPGVPLYIPIKPNNTLKELLGDKPAQLLCSSYGGCSITPPRLASERAAHRRAKLLADYNAGLSASQLARKYEYHIRYVWQMISEANTESPNLTFDF